MLVPPRILYPVGDSGPRGEESQPWPGLRITRLFKSEGLVEEWEEPVERTVQQASERRGVVNEGEG